jgi:hypothetical protein
MSKRFLSKISNSFNDVKLVSLASWKQANEITPRDRGGPYMVTQLAYDPEDTKMADDEFVLGRSGKWLSLKYFFQMPIAERRAEFVFGTAAEIMQMMAGLPSNAAVIRPGQKPPSEPGPGETDEMAAAFNAAREKGQAEKPKSTPGT